MQGNSADRKSVLADLDDGLCMQGNSANRKIVRADLDDGLCMQEIVHADLDDGLCMQGNSADRKIVRARELCTQENYAHKNWVGCARRGTVRAELQAIWLCPELV